MRQQFGTLQFSKFEDIRKKGYQAGMELLEKWESEGRLPPTLIGNSDAFPKRKGRMLRRNSI
jgi:lysophospholipid hydrolase